MSNHHKFPKIHRGAHANSRGILNGPVSVTVKLDGANASIWWDQEQFRLGSRNRELGPDESFNGFRDWVNENTVLLYQIFRNLPVGARLYGEWLVKHQVAYPENMYRQFYAFDVYYPSPVTGELVTLMHSSHNLYLSVTELFDRYELPSVPRIVSGDVTEQDVLDALEHLQTASNVFTHEGIVVSAFGEHDSRSRRAKFLTENFREDKGKRLQIKESAGHTIEGDFIDQFVTPARVAKAQARIAEGRGADEWDITMTGHTINEVFNDLLTEEILTFAQKLRKQKIDALNLKQLKTFSDNKTKEILGL